MKNFNTLTVLLPFFLLGACSGVDKYYANNNNNGNENGNPVCGDGNFDPGEQCDDGAQNSDSAPDACRTDCRLSYCLDGVVDSDEECDQDHLNGQDCTDFGFTHGVLSCNGGCNYDTAQCGTCGDGTAEGNSSDPHYEPCDGSDLRGETCLSIGQAQGTLACTPSCGWDISGCVGGGTTCGNGVLEAGEGCDDGNLDACDGCSPTCIVETCGNGVQECGEECDDGNTSNNDACLNTCFLNTCGDGHLNPSTEECDDGDGVLVDACPDGPLGTCMYATCGDGFTRAGFEQCDDGNHSNSDACPDGPGGTCQVAYCGDGFIQAGVETCEPSSDPSCQNNCQSYCGDGTVDPGEVCDDTISCSANCQNYCGDGVLNSGETCDDGIFMDPYDGGPNTDNWTGGTSFTCLASCAPSWCGDGVCNTWPDPNTGDDERDFCASDCTCSDFGRAQCGTECCPAGETCCGASGCTTQSGLGVQNCGTCGNDCVGNQLCINPGGMGAYCSTI